MKLHWSPRSPFVRKVMVFAHEAGLAERLTLVRTVVAMSKPNLELLRDNPLGKIPTLVTDDVGVLYESVVICEYLDSLHGGAKLFPSSGPRRWHALRWHALGDGMLDTLILWYNERPKPPSQQTPEWLASFALKIRTSLDALEAEAGELARAPLGIGHIAIGCALGYLDFRFAELGWREARPRSAAWFGDFARRSSMQATLPVEG